MKARQLFRYKARQDETICEMVIWALPAAVMLYMWCSHFESKLISIDKSDIPHSKTASIVYFSAAFFSNTGLDG